MRVAIDADGPPYEQEKRYIMSLTATEKRSAKVHYRTISGMFIAHRCGGKAVLGRLSLRVKLAV